MWGPPRMRSNAVGGGLVLYAWRGRLQLWCLYNGFTLCLMQNVHLSLLPPLSFCDWLTSSSEFSHWSFPSLSFNYWFHFGDLRGFWGNKLSNLWKKLNFNIKLNDFLEPMNSLKFYIFSSKSSPFWLHWWPKWSY
jgi:hypothetical protein